MEVFLLCSEGEGHTLLSAFDSALYTAGVGNYNLIYLSSIIPPSTKIQKVEKYFGQGEYGDRLYVVKAETRSEKSGQVLGAGIGWYQFEDKSGLFVEHETQGDEEVEVRTVLENDISRSLKDLCEIRGISFEESRAHSLIHTTKVAALPKSVLVCAVFSSESWGDYDS